MKYPVSARTNLRSRRFHGKTRGHEVLPPTVSAQKTTAVLLHTSCSDVSTDCQETPKTDDCCHRIILGNTDYGGRTRSLRPFRFFPNLKG